MNIVIVGHVDHGKSTIIGRLLADSGSLPQGKLEQVKRNCELNSRSFEYAFLLDSLKDEQSQGVTIDSARVFFKSKKRNYIIIDAPGHIEFLKNMISGASRADAALLVIDAAEGVRENSKRHGYMLSMLGIKQVAVLINKMDLVNYKKKIYQSIVNEYSTFLEKIGIETKLFLPVSGKDGENIVNKNGYINWYNDLTVLQTLDEFIESEDENDKLFRMPVQDIYKFTKDNDDRRVIAGNIESGKIKVGDEIIFYPSGKKSTVKSIEGFNSSVKKEISSGYAASLTLTEQIFITRGEIACKGNELRPKTGKRIKVDLFWLGKEPLNKKKQYLFKLGTAKVNVKLEVIHKAINSSSLEVTSEDKFIKRFETAECTLNLDKSIAFDLTDEVLSTSRFVIVDNYEIAGGGVIKEVLEDKLTHNREDVIERNYKWESSNISPEEREQKYKQKSLLILITGPQGSGRKEVAKELEKFLFEKNYIVYFTGIGNLKYGLDADIKDNDYNREEHIRRLAEVANILLDSGMVLIITARDLMQNDLDIITTSAASDKIKIVWVGEKKTSDVHPDVTVPGICDVSTSVKKIISALFNSKLG